MNYVEAICTIQDYIYTLKSTRPYRCSNRYLDMFSYSHWAAKEIIRRLKENRYESPIREIEIFISQMDEYSTMNINTSYIFSTAKDTAQDILDRFMV